MAEKSVRSTKERTNDENYSLEMEDAQTARRLAYALYDLYKIRYENLHLETQIKGLEKDYIQKQTDWIKRHLAYDPEDLKAHLDKIQEDRERLQERTEKLIREQKSIEREWIKAQANYETAVGDSLSEAEAASYLLGEREAWRETYQKVLEQTEIMQQLLNSKEKIWQRRYALLKEVNPSVDEIKKWRTETETHIDAITESIELQQNYQTSLQIRIALLRKKLSENENTKAVAGHMKNQLQALDKLAERAFEYLSFMQGEKEIAKRLLSEIKAEQKEYALTAKFKEFGNGIKQVWEFELWVVDNNSVTIKKIVIAMIILVVGILFVKYLLRFLYRHIIPYTRMDENAAANIEKLLNYFAITLVILFAMKTVNIPLTAFTFLGGAIAIGVGFGKIGNCFLRNNLYKLSNRCQLKR